MNVMAEQMRYFTRDNFRKQEEMRNPSVLYGL